MESTKLSKYPCNAKKSFGAVDNSELKYVICHAMSYYLQDNCLDKIIVRDVHREAVGTVPCKQCVDFAQYIVNLIMDRSELND